MHSSFIHSLIQALFKYQRYRDKNRQSWFLPGEAYILVEEIDMNESIITHGDKW